MADLLIISSSTIRSANTDKLRLSWKRIDLTPWDLLILQADYTQRGLLFPKPTSRTDTIDLLKSSLSISLDIFYPFAGRLVAVENVDKTTSFFVDCDGSGVKFVHAVDKSITVGDFLEPPGYVPGCMASLFPMNGVKSCEGISEPLLAVQVTELEDGLFIGFGYNHMVADGSSFWHFVNTWSEISLKNSEISMQPIVLKGWFLNGIDHPIHIPSRHTDTIKHKSLPLPVLQERVFHFKKEKISELKAKANAEVGAEPQKISSLQALVGHIWRSITRYRGLNPKQETSCKLLVNMRQRLNPPLGPECFGNVVLFGSAKATVEEMLDHGLGWAALQINQMVGLQTDQEARKFVENWVKCPEILNLGGEIVMTNNNSMIVASSPRLKVDGNDFGWGKPIAVRAGPGNYTDGKLVVFPGIEEGSIDIQVCLSPDTLKGLSTDAEFLKSAAMV